MLMNKDMIYLFMLKGYKHLHSFFIWTSTKQWPPSSPVCTELWECVCIFLVHTTVSIPANWGLPCGLWCQHAWFAVQPPIHVCSYMPRLPPVLYQNNVPLSQCTFISFSKGKVFYNHFTLLVCRIKSFRTSTCQMGKHLHTKRTEI